jgi:hypothetical protein
MNGKPKLTVFGSMNNKDPKRDIQNQIIARGRMTIICQIPEAG